MLQFLIIFLVGIGPEFWLEHGAANHLTAPGDAESSPAGPASASLAAASLRRGGDQPEHAAGRHRLKP